jgi:hypothetical protein
VRSGFEREVRFLVDPAAAESQLREILPWLTPEVHDPDRPVAWTRTTYLDTAENRYFLASERAVVQRLRVREYGSAPDLESAPRFSGLSSLELKVTHGCRRKKVRWWAPSDLVTGAISGERDALACCPRILRRHLRRALRPRVVTWYRRLAFTTATPSQVRLTIDLDLRFTRPDGRLLASWDSAVVEAKSSGEPPAWLAAVLGRLGDPQAFSKFRAGMLLLGGSPCALSSSPCSSDAPAAPPIPACP